MVLARFFHNFLKHHGAITIVILSTLLALLAMDWIGYDLRQFSVALIGDPYDPYLEKWSIYQAIDNLLNRPDNLGYAIHYYNDENAFAYTTAPYGIAVAVLPVYLLSSGNLDLSSIPSPKIADKKGNL